MKYKSGALKSPYITLVLGIAAFLAFGLLFIPLIEGSPNMVFSKAEVDVNVSKKGEIHQLETYKIQSGVEHGVYRYLHEDPINASSRNCPDFYWSEAGGDLPAVVPGWLKNEFGDAKTNKNLSVLICVIQKHQGVSKGKEVSFEFYLDRKNSLFASEEGSMVFHKLWASDWDAKILNLTANVQLPMEVDDLYIHPRTIELERRKISKTGGTTNLNLGFKNVPRKQFVEIKTLSDQNPFEFNTGLNPKKERQKETGYKLKLYLNAFFNIILEVLIVLFPLVFFLHLYFKYGKEGEAKELPYLRELPSDLPPAIVHTILDAAEDKKPNPRTITATLMDLYSRGKIKIQEVESKGIILSHKDYEIEIIDKTGLKDFEKDLIEFFENKAGRKFRWKKFMNSLESNIEKARDYKNFFERWQNKLLRIADTDEYISQKGFNKFRKVVGGFGIALFIFILLLSLVKQNTGQRLLRSFLVWIEEPFIKNLYCPGIFISALISFIETFTFILLPREILGRWTKRGLEFVRKWRAFKRYISDFSLLKEKPPESVKLWEKYLVYAVALGVAEKTIKALKSIKPEVIEAHPNIYIMATTDFRTSVSSSVSTARSSLSSGGSGGGGFGGGGGGGGGGGF